MKQLDAIHDPLFRCTIFRRTAPELKRQGGLVDESKKVYKYFDAVYKTQAQEWCFSSGAKVSFSAIATDDDLGGWQGSQLTRVDMPLYRVIYIENRVNSVNPQNGQYRAKLVLY